MKKGLNLNVLMEETWDVVSGDITIHVKKPTEEMVLKINDTVKVLEGKQADLPTVMPKTAELVAEILSNNTDNIKFAPGSPEIVAMPINVRMIVIREYTSIIQEISTDPS